MTADEAKLNAAATTSKTGGKPPRTLADVSSLSGSSTAQVSDAEKKIRRAERFGISVQLSEQEKRNSRAERFGTASAPKETDDSKNSEELKRKARAERFGLAALVDDKAKKKARLERFGKAPETDTVEEEKKKARLTRFSKPLLGSLSMDGKGNIEPKAAIVTNAGGGPTTTELPQCAGLALGC